MDSSCLVLRLAGPMQSWGRTSQFNQRRTDLWPTKSGVLGLLAAAEGRRRKDPIEDLLHLQFGVRVDQAGTMLRDYHTVSDHRGRPLLSANVNKQGSAEENTAKKYTAVTQRYYLQDAVFVVAVNGEPSFLENLAGVMRRPAFPLALGRRACPPTQPLVIEPDSDGPGALWPYSLEETLTRVPWMASRSTRPRVEGEGMLTVRLATVLDDDRGHDFVVDVPRSFDLDHPGFDARRVRHGWVEIASGASAVETTSSWGHDPFALLGW